MKLVGSGNQMVSHPLYDLSGTLAGTTPVLALPRAQSRTFLAIQNTGASTIYVDFGYAKGTAVMAGSAPNMSVASVTVTNAGQGYSFPPRVIFFGGGSPGSPFWNSTFLGVGLPDEVSPPNFAQAQAILSGSAPNATIGSVNIDNSGSGYSIAPYVYFENDPNDPYGCVAATAASAIALAPGSETIAFNGTFCPTTPVVIVGSAGGTYALKFAP
jgi:hypothetical protein